jgi:hypothetical protein
MLGRGERFSLDAFIRNNKESMKETSRIEGTGKLIGWPLVAHLLYKRIMKRIGPQ